jgi:hypothetical protein
VEQELLTLPEHLSSPPVFGSCYSIFSFICFIDSCLSFCTFFFWPSCCLFLDIRILITPLVSSSSSYLVCDDTKLVGLFTDLLLFFQWKNNSRLILGECNVKICDYRNIDIDTVIYSGI